MLRIVGTQSFSRELLVDVGVGGIVRIVTTPRVVSVGAAHQKAPVSCLGQNTDVVLTIVL